MKQKDLLDVLKERSVANPYLRFLADSGLRVLWSSTLNLVELNLVCHGFHAVASE